MNRDGIRDAVPITETNYRITTPSARVLCPDHLAPVIYIGAGTVECPLCSRQFSPADGDLLNVYDAVLILKGRLDAIEARNAG